MFKRGGKMHAVLDTSHVIHVVSHRGVRSKHSPTSSDAGEWRRALGEARRPVPSDGMADCDLSSKKPLRTTCINTVANLQITDFYLWLPIQGCGLGRGEGSCPVTGEQESRVQDERDPRHVPEGRDCSLNWGSTLTVRTVVFSHETFCCRWCPATPLL